MYTHAPAVIQGIQGENNVFIAQKVSFARYCRRTIIIETSRTQCGFHVSFVFASRRHKVAGAFGVPVDGKTRRKTIFPRSCDRVPVHTRRNDDDRVTSAVRVHRCSGKIAVRWLQQYGRRRFVVTRTFIAVESRVGGPDTGTRRDGAWCVAQRSASGLGGVHLTRRSRCSRSTIANRRRRPGAQYYNSINQV